MRTDRKTSVCVCARARFFLFHEQAMPKSLTHFTLWIRDGVCVELSFETGRERANCMILSPFLIESS